MMKITLGKGFHITFANGWTASVQWGVGNYCDHNSAWSSTLSIKATDQVVGYTGSKTAEVARWKGDGNMEQLDNGDTVKGYLPADEVLAFLVETAAKE